MELSFTFVWFQLWFIDWFNWILHHSPKDTQNHLKNITLIIFIKGIYVHFSWHVLNLLKYAEMLSCSPYTEQVFCHYQITVVWNSLCASWAKGKMKKKIVLFGHISLSITLIAVHSCSINALWRWYSRVWEKWLKSHMNSIQSKYTKNIKHIMPTDLNNTQTYRRDNGRD